MARGTHVAEPTGGGWKPAGIGRMRAAGEPFRRRSFERACAELEIEHRLTKPDHPWSLEDQQTIQWIVCPTNGRVERRNRALEEAALRRYPCDTRDALRAHLGTFLDACNFAGRLNTLRGLTPFEFISQGWASEPHRFRPHPDHLSPGPSS